MCGMKLAGWRGIAAVVAFAVGAAPQPATAAAPAEQVYLDALRATTAVPLPALVTFKEDVTGRNLHPVCSASADGGEFSVDGGGGRNGGTYLLTYYANERQGSVEDLRTHERCTGSGLFAPVASASDGMRRASRSRGVSLDDVVGETLRDERKTYLIAFDGEATVDGARTSKLVLTPRSDGGDVAQKVIYVDQATSRIRAVWARYGDMSWAGGAHVDIEAHFGPVEAYWLVSTWSLTVNARALVVPLHYAFSAHAYDYRFSGRRQATSPAS